MDRTFLSLILYLFKAKEARVPKATDIKDVKKATSTLFLKEFINCLFSINSIYHLKERPPMGKDKLLASLKEKRIIINIGRKRNASTRIIYILNIRELFSLILKFSPLQKNLV